MNTKEFFVMATKCVLCCHQIDQKFGYYNVGKTRIESSNKTIKNILMHLSKCIKTEYKFDDKSCVCSFCFGKLFEYDEIMIQLLNYQKELSKMLEESIKHFDNESQLSKMLEESINQSYNESDEEQGWNYKVEELASDFSNDNEDDNMEDSNQDYTENDAFDRPSRSFDCTICDKKWKTKKSFKRHLETHGKDVKCTICGAVRKDEEYLELHMNIHEGKTENECRYCSKRYSRRANVIRHMHLHWDKKKFQCEKCGVRFSQANLLYNHKMIHEAEEQPIICSICEQTFKSKKTFKHHMITHREDRPMHPCEICGKKFTERYTLKMHLKTHSECKEEESEIPKKNIAPSKRYPCIICEKVLNTMESLETHRAKEHDVVGLQEFF